MPECGRQWIGGGTFFFTLVTYDRRPWLCDAWARVALRHAIANVRRRHPFDIDAWVLLPDHLHCIWTLPPLDRNYASRWRLIKMLVAKACDSAELFDPQSRSKRKRKECGLWQRRYWEHAIRDERDFAAHADYIHYNPVKHGLCPAPGDWPFSTFHRAARKGLYPVDWGSAKAPVLAAHVGQE